MPIASRRSFPALALALAFALVPLPSSLLAQNTATRQAHVLVSVLDKDDAPVAGLGPRDFVVREDDVSREIIAVTPGAAPGHVVLLVDDSQAASDAVPFMRDGLDAFIGAMTSHAPPAQVRITTFGDRPTLRQEFTGTPAALTRAARGIFPQTGSGSRLLEAIIETCRDLKTKRLDAAAIVVVIAESGPEFSEDSHARVEQVLREAGATLWTVVLHDPRGGDRSTEGRERAIVIGDVTRATGGLTKTVLTPQALAPALRATADALLGRYDVTYGRPDRLIPPSRLAVESPGHGSAVLARQWPTP